MIAIVYSYCTLYRNEISYKKFGAKMKSINDVNNEETTTTNKSSFGGMNSSKPEQSPQSFRKEYTAPAQMFSGKRNDVLASFVEKSREIIKLSDADITVVPIDSKNNRVGMDAAFFIYKLGKVAIVCYVGLTNTSVSLTPKTLENGNQRITCDLYPQDIIQDKFALESIQKILLAELQGSEGRITVPVYRNLLTSPSVNSESYTAEVTEILGIVWSAIQIDINKFAAAGGTLPDSYSKYMASNFMTKDYVTSLNGENAAIEITHERRSDLVMRDSSGVSINPDIIFHSDIRGKEKEGQVLSQNSFNSEVCKVGISADIMRAGAPVLSNDSEKRVLPGQNATMSSQYYYPVIRFDAIETNKPSMATVLLGLITGFAPFAAEYAYLYPFMTEKSDMKTEISKLSHIGGVWAELGFLHADPTKIGNASTSVLSLSMEQKLEVISSIMRTKPRFTMVCSALQNDFCFTSVIKEAAHKLVGNTITQSPNDPIAYRMIIDEANRLTNNHFSTFFEAGKPIAITTDSLRPIGTVEMADGVYNINKITYKYLTNAFSGNKEKLDSLSEYCNYLYRGTSDSSRVSLQRQIQYLQTYVDGHINVVGYGEEVEISPEFVKALINAYAKSGVGINVPKIGYNVQITTDRAFSPDVFSGSLGGATVNQGFSGASGIGGGFVTNSFNLGI